MKLCLFALLCPAIILASNNEEFDNLTEFSLKKRNLLLNILIKKLIAYIRHIITQGSSIFGIPILDPFEKENFHLIIPTGLLQLDLSLTNISVIGFGGFVFQKNILYLSNLTFEIELYLPRVILRADTILISETDNDFISAIPMYKKDKTELEMDNFRLQANLYLKQSDDEKSILIDKIENISLDIASFMINSDGAVDGENFEIFSDLEQGLLEYTKNCKNVILKLVTNTILTFGNPILNRLDTWRYIAVLL